MANFTYLKKSGNLVEDATVTASTQDANFPGSNAGALPVSQPWKSASGVVTGAKILIDLGSAMAVDALSVVNHNLRSGSTITARAGTTADPDGTSFNTTLPFNSGLSWKLLAAAETWRYWSFELGDSGHPDNFLRAGYCMLGVFTTLSHHQFEAGWTVTPEKIVRQIENEFGTPMVGALVASPSRISFSWQGLSGTQRDELRDFLDSLDLGVDPILLIPETTDTEAYFARLQDGWSVSHGQTLASTNFDSVDFLTDGFGLVTA